MLWSRRSPTLDDQATQTQQVIPDLLMVPAENASASRCSGHEPVTRGSLTWIFPAFSRPELKRLEARLTPSRALEGCIRLTDHQLFELAKRARDGITHRRRIRFEGHGTSPIAYGSAVYQPEEAELHHALVVAFYDQIIRPVVGHAG